MRANLSTAFAAFRRFGLAAAAFTLAGTSLAGAQDAIVKPGYAVVTGFAGTMPGEPPEGADPTDYLSINTQGISAEVDDLTAVGAQGVLSTVPKTFTVNPTQVGQVFGVTLDRAKAPNIYLAATSAYGLSIYTPDESGTLKRIAEGAPGAQFVPGQFGPPDQGGGPGSIWRVDGVTGAVTLLTTVDGGAGSVAALGGLAFDPATSQIFAAERGTGIIYRIGLDGTINGTYDHGTEGRPSAGLPPIAMTPTAPVNIEDPSFDTGNPTTWGIAAPARRIFGLGVYNRRLYYAVAQGPQIWSAAIQPSGSISNARLEVDVPSLADGVEIAQIAFDGAGRMYLGERGATTGDYALTQLANEAQSRTLRFVPKPPGDPSPGLWRLAPDVYSVGLPPNYANANGGVALNYGYDQNGNINLKACGATVWSTGERLLDPGDGSTGFTPVEGLQGNSTTLFQPQNTPPTQSWFVDYDDQPGDVSLRGYLGSIATIQCAGAPPPPPPPICPPNTRLQNGVCIPFCPPGTNLRNGQCQPPPCAKPTVRQSNGQCGCPNPNDVLTRDGKRCEPPRCPPPTVRYQNGVCGCPNPNQILSRDGLRCVPPPCDLRANDIYNGQCVPKCPQGQQHTGQNGDCKPKCPNGIGPGCLPPPVFCNPQTHEFYNNQCVEKCRPPRTRQADGSCGIKIIGPIFPFCDTSTHELVGGNCVVKCKSPSVRLPNGKCSLVLQPIGPILVNPPLHVLPLICQADEEPYKGACVKKCVAPQVRLSNGSCGLQFQIPGLQLQIKP
jgi:hypothetical protein